MKQLLISPKIHKFAKDYADNLFADKGDSFVKPKDGLTNLLLDILEVNDYLEDKEQYIAYIEKIIHEYDNLKVLLPSAFPKYKQQFDNLLPEERLSSIIKCRKLRLPKNKEERMSLKSQEVTFYQEVVKRMQYSEARSYLAPIMQELGINTCVYCNKAAAVYSEELEEAYYHFDHWLPKSQYPFLCICFYNLYPCCSNCNEHKLDGSKGSFQLYSENQSSSDPFVFMIDRSDYVSMKSNSLSVVFSARSHTDEDYKEEYNKVFRISHIYNDAASLRECEKLIYDIDKYRCSYPDATEKSIPGIVDKNELFHHTLGIDDDITNIFTDSKKKLKLDTAYDAKLL